jgi:hypothetical protein
MKIYASLLLLLGLVTFTLAQDDDEGKIYCNPAFALRAACGGDEEPYTPICAYYEKNCPYKICGKRVRNGCEACLDPDVIYYTSDDCKDEEAISACYSGICDQKNDPAKYEAFQPVCGIRKGCKRGDCTQTYYNECYVCKWKNYPWYYDGVCRDEREYCRRPRPKSCSGKRTDYKCAFWKDEYGKIVFTTVKNSCEACRDPDVDYYIDGACGPMKDNAKYCLPSKRTQSCTYTYKPVCAYYRDEYGDITYETYNNACSACKNYDVLYYLPGECP